MSTSDPRDEAPPAPAAPAAPGKVTLPPFGLAQDILRQLGGGNLGAAPSAPAVAAPGPKPSSDPGAHVAAGTSAPVIAGRDSLLQFADAVTSVGGNEEARAAVAEEHLVTFLLADEEFAIPVMRTREIVRVGTLTRIPEAPAHVRGVFNLRGRILPVIDLRTRLGLPPAEIGPKTRLVLVEAHTRTLALLVDALATICRIPVPEIKPPPTDVLSAQTDYVVGVAQRGDRVLVLLDLDRVLLFSP